MTNSLTDGQVVALITGAVVMAAKAWEVIGTKFNTKTTADTTREAQLWKRIAEVETGKQNEEKMHEEKMKDKDARIETLLKERDEWRQKYLDTYSDKVQLEFELWKVNKIETITDTKEIIVTDTKETTVTKILPAAPTASEVEEGLQAT